MSFEISGNVQQFSFLFLNATAEMRGVEEAHNLVGCQNCCSCLGICNNLANNSVEAMQEAREGLDV
jgi:hypothetical protein